MIRPAGGGTRHDRVHPAWLPADRGAAGQVLGERGAASSVRALYAGGGAVVRRGPKGRLTLEQRRTLAETLTDAVLVPEVGQFAPPARVGFQVHFVEREPDMMAIGGRLLADSAPGVDAMAIDVAVMDGEPSPAWWVNFRVIDEGGWGSSGGVLSVLSLLGSGVFTEEKAKAVRAALGA